MIGAYIFSALLLGLTLWLVVWSILDDRRHRDDPPSDDDDHFDYSDYQNR